MAIDPKLVSIISASDLPTGDPTSAGQFFFFEGNEMKKAPMTNIYDKVTSGIKGNATQSNAPTTYSAETYPDGLFERYVVSAPITAPNSWGNIAVTQAELDANTVFFNVTNGVVSKEASLKPEPSMESVFTPTDNEKGATMKATYDFLKTIESDGQNLLLPKGYDEILNVDFAGWTAVNSATAVSGLITLNGVESVAFKDLTYPTGNYRIEVFVESISGTAKILIGDVFDGNGDFNVALEQGLNIINYVPPVGTDKTVIFKQYDAGVTQISSLRFLNPIATVDKIALNVSATDERIWINKNAFTSNDYEAFSLTNTTVGGEINISGGGTLNNRIEIPWHTLHENAEIETVYIENSASKMLFGFHAQNKFEWKHHVYMTFNTSGANFGKIEVFRGDGTSAGISTQSNTAYAVGDVLKLTVKRLGLKYTFTVHNQKRGWKISYEVQCTPLGLPFVAHNEAKPAFSMINGNVNVKSFKFTSLSENIDVALVGDSITFGQSATSEELRWASLIDGNNIVSGGGADVTTSVLNRIEEIIKMKPRKAVLMIAGNDILFSETTAIWKENLRQIRAALHTEGIEVIHAFPTPRAGATELINFLVTEPTFTNDIKIDTCTPLMNGSAEVLKSEYNSGDNLHPNTAGMAKIAETINNVL